MSNDETENKSCECDDPCDDCSSTNALTGWVTLQKKDNKPLDNSSES